MIKYKVTPVSIVQSEHMKIGDIFQPTYDKDETPGEIISIIAVEEPRNDVDLIITRHILEC